jgi:hypothetical protein
MKKMIFAVLFAACSILNACATKDKVITFDQLPASAQATVLQYFTAADIAYVTLDQEILGKQYEVRFNDGKTMEFEKDGSLRSVDYKLEQVPDALVPEQVRQQVAASFPQAFIVEWGKDDWGWKAELNNKLDVKFNSKLEMIGIDD